MTEEITEIPDLQEFQMKDTTTVQVRSVLNYMYALGYTLDTTSKARFVTEQAGGQGNRFLSIHTAIKLHNSTDCDWDNFNGVVFPRAVTHQTGFTALGVKLAMASKLVDKVKISVNRQGAVITQDFMVKPLNETVLQLVEPA